MNMSETETEFQTFFITFNEQLELLQEPGMMCEGWSWDRTAAWLLYNAKGNDMAPRTRKAKTSNETAAKLLEALKFLSVGYSGTGDEQATHTWLQDGWGASFNGIVTAATPIEGLDLNAFPDTELMTEALSHVGKELELTVEDTGVHIVSGDYDAVIPVGDRTKTIPPSPDQPVADLPPGFVGAMERCSRLITDSAQTVRDASIWARPHEGNNYATTLVSTNGKTMIESQIGGYIAANILFPKIFVTALGKCGKEPKQWGFSPSSFTVWFEDGSYIKTNTYDPASYPREVTDKIEVLMQAPSVNAPPKGFFEAVAAVAPFTDGTIYFLGGHVRGAPNDDWSEWGCTVAVDKLPDGVGTNAKAVLLFKDEPNLKLWLGTNAEHPHRVIAIGDTFRAAIGGVSSEPPMPQGEDKGTQYAPPSPQQGWQAPGNPPPGGFAPPAGAAPSAAPASTSSGQSTQQQDNSTVQAGGWGQSPASAEQSHSSPPAWGSAPVHSEVSATATDPSLPPAGQTAFSAPMQQPNAAPVQTQPGAGYPTSFTFTATPPEQWSNVDNGEDGDLF